MDIFVPSEILFMKPLSLKSVYFIGIFVVAKASVFLGPLLLSGVISAESYGVFEYTLALGSLLAIFINSGISTAYPYFILRKGQYHFQNIFYFHPLVTASLPLISILLFFLDFIGIKLLYSILVAYILSMQMLISSKLKAEERSSLAAVSESGIFLVLISALLLLYMFNLEEVKVFWWLLVSYCFLLLIFFSYKVKGIQLIKIKEIYPQLLKFGFPIIFSSVFIIVITTSGRILVEHFINTYSVAVYSFYFRLASIVIIFYQIISVVYYKKIYTVSHQKLDAFFSTFLLCVLLLGILGFFTVPVVGVHFLSFLRETIGLYKNLYSLLIFQMIFWIAIALNENVIYREDLAKKLNIKFLFLCLLLILILYLISFFSTLSLGELVLIHSTAMYAGTEVQFFLLSKHRKITFKRTRIITFACFILLWVTYSYWFLDLI